MRRGVLIIFLIIVMLVAAGYFLMSKGSFQSLSDQESNGLDADASAEQENQEEQVVEQEIVEERNLIYPTLTYEGAYNGPLYATSEQVGGAELNPDTFFAMLDQNGVNYFMGMFSIVGQPTSDKLVSHDYLGYAVSFVEKYPGRVVPFFNTGFGGEEIQDDGLLGDKLTRSLTESLAATKLVAGDDFIRGIGELEMMDWSVRHDDQKVMEIIDLAAKNNIDIFFHPTNGKIDDIPTFVEKYPNTNFIFHLYRSDLKSGEAKFIEYLKKYPNLYFSMDAAHIVHVDGNDILYDYESSSKAQSVSRFKSTFDSNYESLVNSAVRSYKPLVDAAPTKIMWGTEAGPEYAFDPEVYNRLIKISRAVIGEFEPEHQELVGYKNALALFGEGVTLDIDLAVVNTAGWPNCNPAQEEMCECSEDLNEFEEEACFSDCSIENKCIEVIEDDI